MGAQSRIVYGFFLGLILFSAQSFGASLSFSILQTGDIHSHFLNNDSPFRLGGVARLATEIQKIRSQKQNVLVLDAGDFSEGSIFYTYNHGASSLELMKAIGYDAMVLGNHDWLVGPRELYTSMNNVQFPIPILSGNLDTSGLSADIPLEKYIRPYIIKDMNGVRVGILGLSTFQFIFDQFFLPVKLMDPVAAAKKWIDEMRANQGCQVVIVLSHLGFTADKDLANKVPGVDVIVGGHTHVLLKSAYQQGNVPITHVGKWGQYLGDFDFNYDGKSVTLTNYQIHQISSDIGENPYVKALVDGTISGLESTVGPLFSKVALVSDRDLPTKDYRSDDIVGHWVADALRSFTKSDVAFENPSYVAQDILEGATTFADLFNIFPHIYNPQTKKAWTVKTFKITGAYMQLLLSAVYRSGIYLRLSNAKAVIDLYKSVDQLHSLQVGGQPIDPERVYTVAGTDGITQAIELLKNYGIDVGVTEINDTGVEAWRLIGDYFRTLSPITKEKIVWEGRVRTLQPDVTIRPEELEHSLTRSNILHISVVVRNTGMQMASGAELTLKRAAHPGDTLESKDIDMISSSHPVSIRNLPPGDAQTVSLDIDTTNMSPGRYAVVFSLTPVIGELEVENNVLDTYIDVPEKTPLGTFNLSAAPLSSTLDVGIRPSIDAVP